MEVKNTLKHDALLILLMIIPYYRPASISLMYGNSLFALAFDLLRIVSFVLTILFLLKTAINSNMCMPLTCYAALMLFSTLVNRAALGGRVVAIANMIGIFLLYKIWFRKNPALFIQINYQYLFLMILINTLLTIVFPLGLNGAGNESRINFLGIDNMISMYFLTTIAFAVLYQNIFPESYLPLIGTILIVVTTLFYKSGSGVIAVLFTIVGVITLNFNLIKGRSITPYYALFFFALLELLLVFWNNVSFLTPVFNLLGKSATFSDRRYYWDNAISLWSKKKMFGLGSGITTLWDANYYSHNAVLDVLMKGGIAGLIVSAVIMFKASKNIQSLTDHKVKSMMTVSMFAFLLIGLMEGLEDRIMFNAFIALLSCLADIADNGVLNGMTIGKNVNIVLGRKQVLL